MTAHMTFEDAKAIEKFENMWNIAYIKDYCRLALANVTKDEIKMQNNFTLKLTNLLFGITAYDLREIIERVKAKICFIPRTRDKYARLRYAFVSFESEDEMTNAYTGNDQFDIKGQRLIWKFVDSKTCHKCDSPNYLVKDCEEREQSNIRKQKIAQFRNIYTRYRVPNYRRYNRYQPQQQQQDREERQENEQVDFNKEQEQGNFDDELKNIYALLKQIKDDMSNMKKNMLKITERIDKIEGKPQTTQINNIESNNTIEQSNTQQIHTNKNKGKAINRQGPVNDRGFISGYDRQRRNVARNFDQNFNDNNKKGALNSEEHTQSSTGDNITKTRKRDSNTITPSNDINKEIKELRDNLKQ